HPAEEHLRFGVDVHVAVIGRPAAEDVQRSAALATAWVANDQGGAAAAVHVAAGGERQAQAADLVLDEVGARVVGGGARAVPALLPVKEVRQVVTGLANDREVVDAVTVDVPEPDGIRVEAREVAAERRPDVAGVKLAVEALPAAVDDGGQ